MTTAQRVIKYFAIGFAGLLAFSIFAGIAGAALGLFAVVGIIGGNIDVPEAAVECAQYEKCLSLQLGYSELHIKTGGEKIAIESSDDEYEISKSSDVNVVIKDKKGANWFGDKKREIVVTIPEDLDFDVVGIAAGAGKIDVEKLNAKELKMSLGAGKTVVKNVKVSSGTQIATGAGSFALEDGELHDAKIDLGVGETNIRAKLLGNSKIDAGIGSVNLDLIGTEYEVEVNKGIGEVRYNDTVVPDDSIVGSGENKINIHGGIGDIRITTSVAAD